MAKLERTHVNEARAHLGREVEEGNINDARRARELAIAHALIDIAQTLRGIEQTLDIANQRD